MLCVTRVCSGVRSARQRLGPNEFIGEMHGIPPAWLVHKLRRIKHLLLASQTPRMAARLLLLAAAPTLALALVSFGPKKVDALPPPGFEWASPTRGRVVPTLPVKNPAAAILPSAGKAGAAGKEGAVGKKNVCIRMCGQKLQDRLAALALTEAEKLLASRKGILPLSN